MKNKLLTLMILSIISTISFIIFITSYFHTWYGLIGTIIFFGCGIAQLIIGIMVLVERDKINERSGITLAAGIIGILFGIFLVGAIVSGIAMSNFTKEKNIKMHNNMNSRFSLNSQPQTQQTTNEDDEFEKVKKELEELKRKKSQINDETSKLKN